MLTFKQFLKQKKLYNLDNTKDEYVNVYNKDLSVIDKDLEYETEIKDGYVSKVSKTSSEDDIDPRELKDAGGSNALRNVAGIDHWIEDEDSENFEDSENSGDVYEDDGCAGGCSVAPSVSAGPGTSSASVAIAPSVSAPDASVGGTTSMDIAGVPFGLTANSQKLNDKKDKRDNDIISRMDAYI